MGALFQGYSCPSDYENAGLKYLTPMTCQELTVNDDGSWPINLDDYYVEEKLDGTRGTLFIMDECMRVFSRRVSVKTGWFCENTDSVPHIRDFEGCCPDMSGTVLDGEMYIPLRPFKDVAATLNCKWDEAVRRQESLGKICIRVFDIRYYKGIKVENMPLHRRKFFLDLAVKQLASPYVVIHPFYADRVPVTKEMGKFIEENLDPDKYPQLAEDLGEPSYGTYDKGSISKRGYYEYIIMMGGEGVILKDKNGKYHEKRGKEFLKVKKLLTREVVITGFSEATREYTGKFPKDYWPYWVLPNGEKYYAEDGESASGHVKSGYTPVTRFWFEDWIGAVRYGVYITQEEYEAIPPKKRGDVYYMDTSHGRSKVLLMEVGECSGFDDGVRSHISEHRTEYLGKVLEVRCNEIFNDTGKMRHPRWFRVREDKAPSQCTWKDHIPQKSAYSMRV